ncbi:MAG: protein-L-isoaspartate O-methyltransferase [Amphiamblys sp. WSBS2006]|nr:MAG: protein-L-isoaspartate O-methyltransferase [Amphiamblys sp. WSBS2006]
MNEAKNENKILLLYLNKTTRKKEAVVLTETENKTLGSCLGGELLTETSIADKNLHGTHISADDGEIRKNAPYSLVCVSYAVERVPPVLIDTLRPSGRLLIPVLFGYKKQLKELIEKIEDGKIKVTMCGESFYPHEQPPDCSA